MKKLNLRHLPRRFVILGTAALLALGAVIPAATAFAASNQSTAKCPPNGVSCVIAAGDTAITNRLTSLNTLSNKVSTDLTEHKITSDQASALQSDVSNNETGLKNLKTKLDAETTATAARQDVGNIFTQYRIYAVVLPRDYRQLEMDIEINAKDVMQGVEPALSAAISKAPANKQTQLNSLYNDYQKQVTDAQTQINSAQQDFPSMTPQNFNQHQASYEATRLALDNALKAARADLHQAAKDLRQMANVLGIKA